MKPIDKIFKPKTQEEINYCLDRLDLSSKFKLILKHEIHNKLLLFDPVSQNLYAEIKKIVDGLDTNGLDVIIRPKYNRQHHHTEIFISQKCPALIPGFPEGNEPRGEIILDIIYIIPYLDNSDENI